MIRPFYSRWRIKTDSVAALGVTLAPIVFFLPAISAGAVLCPADGIIQNVPFRVAFAQMLRSGHLPLWDPYIFSGMPFLAAAQPGILFPLNWFYVLFSPATATNLMVISSYMVAALGAYLYSRRIGASVAGAIFTSLVWQMSGALIGQISHINIVHTAAILPWVLWSIDRYAVTSSFKTGAVLAGLIAIQIFAGHQQAFVYSTLLVFAYAITMAIANANARRRYLSSLAFIATGVLLAAVQILPTFELLRNSERSRATYEFFTSFSMPRRFVLAFVAPYLMGGGDGRLFRAPYVGPPFYTEFVGYAGGLAIMLVAVAIFVKPDARAKFWAIVAVVCLLLAFGGYAPLHLYKLIYYLPVLNLFRVPARHLMEVDFALAVLAGRGLTVLTAKRHDPRVRVKLALVSVSVFILTSLAVTLLRPSEFHLGREAPVSFLRAPELFMPVFIAGASCWALWWFARQRRGATAVLFTVLVFDLALWGQSSGWYNASPRTTDEIWREPEAIAVLRGIMKNDATPQRILTAPHNFDPAVPPVGPSVSHSASWNLWTQPDVYMMYGIQNAAGYDGFGLDRYQKLAGEMKVWGELTEPDATLRGESREIDLVNARYLVSMRERPATALSNAFAPATEKFGDSMFANTNLEAPVIDKGKRLSFSTAPVEIDHVAMLTSLAWSENVPDQTIVARLRLRTADGRLLELPLRAGIDTAEWAYDRPDIRARIRHRRPTVATSYEVNDAGGDYEAHNFVSSMALPEKATVVSGDLVLEPDARWPDLTVSVFRISLVDQNAGKTYALDRNSISVDNSVAPVKPQSKAESPNDRWKLLTQTQYVDIYENARALPRVWMASEARVLNAPAMLEVIRGGKFSDGSKWDPVRTVLIESEVDQKPAAASQANASITKYKPNQIDVSTKSDAASILVLSENHYPGWRAYVDGQLVETMRVDYNLRGVSVPAGEHRVEFVYRPKSVLIGLVISLAALAILMGGIVVERRRGLMIGND